MAPSECLARLRAAYAENPRRRVLLRGDTVLPYRVMRVFFGQVVLPANDGLADLTSRELWLLAPLAIVIVATGVWPRPMLNLIAQDVARIHALLVAS